MRHKLRALRRCNRGATAIEYGLIVALIAIALIAGMRSVAGPTTSLWSKIADHVDSSTNKP